MKIKRINTNIILKYIFMLFIYLVFSIAKIGELSPFLFAFYLASVYAGFDEKIMSLYCLASSVIFGFNLNNFLCALTMVAVVLVVFYFHRLIKRKLKLTTTFVCYLIGLITYIYYNYNNVKDLIFYLILGYICLYAFIVVLQVLALRKNCFKLTLDESICFLFTIGLIGVGLGPIAIFHIEIYKILIFLLIFVLASINNYKLAFSISLSFAFGVSLSLMQPLVIAEIALITLFSAIFTIPNKFKIILSSLLVEIVVQYFFVTNSVYLLYNLIPLAISGVIFLFIPNKTLNKISDFVYVKNSEISSRNLINITRKNLKKRMCELSNIFLDMKQIHLGMIKKDLTKTELIDMLTREVMSTCCKDCLDKTRCTRSLGTDNKSNLATLIEIAVSKGKITLLDLPSGLTNRCGKINYLVTLINRLTDEYKQYKNMISDVNNVKLLLADQMGAVSKLLLNIGDEIDTNISFDIARENKIISRLLSLNIECREVLLYTEKNDEMSAVLIIKPMDNYSEIVEKVLYECLKVKMKIFSERPVEDTEYISITLKRQNKYDCVFGLASCNKAGNVECGDCHSILRLGQDKFLLALCDGMGSGKNANKMSAMTLGLIENFYKVGFDNEVIMESVNKLLQVNNQENYSTLDVCLMDLNVGIADFIKVGSPYGFIKREGKVEVIQGGALPIGAMETIKPATYQTVINTKDIVVMATDGVADAFETQENFEEFVLKLASNNPQTLAETILNEALLLNNMQAKDDMTVLVARTYLK